MVIKPGIIRGFKIKEISGKNYEIREIDEFCPIFVILLSASFALLCDYVTI